MIYSPRGEQEPRYWILRQLLFSKSSAVELVTSVEVKIKSLFIVYSSQNGVCDWLRRMEYDWMIFYLSNHVKEISIL